MGPRTETVFVTFMVSKEGGKEEGTQESGPERGKLLLAMDGSGAGTTGGLEGEG